MKRILAALCLTSGVLAFCADGDAGCCRPGDTGICYDLTKVEGQWRQVLEQCGAREERQPRNRASKDPFHRKAPEAPSSIRSEPGRLSDGGISGG